MKRFSFLAILLACGCATEPKETPRIEVWSHSASGSRYIISVSSKVSSQTYMDTLSMPSGRFYSDFSVVCDHGDGNVSVFGENDKLLKEFPYQADAIVPGRRYIDTLSLDVPKKVIVRFQDFSGILTYELRSVE